MVILIIFPVILQTVINVIMLSIGGQGTTLDDLEGEYTATQTAMYGL